MILPGGVLGEENRGILVPAEPGLGGCPAASAADAPGGWPAAAAADAPCALAAFSAFGSGLGSCFGSCSVLYIWTFGAGIS